MPDRRNCSVEKVFSAIVLLSVAVALIMHHQPPEGVAPADAEGIARASLILAIAYTAALWIWKKLIRRLSEDRTRSR